MAISHGMEAGVTSHRGQADGLDGHWLHAELEAMRAEREAMRAELEEMRQERAALLEKNERMESRLQYLEREVLRVTSSQWITVTERAETGSSKGGLKTDLDNDKGHVVCKNSTAVVKKRSGETKRSRKCKPVMSVASFVLSNETHSSAAVTDKKHNNGELRRIKRKTKQDEASDNDLWVSELRMTRASTKKHHIGFLMSRNTHERSVKRQSSSVKHRAGSVAQWRFVKSTSINKKAMKTKLEMNFDESGDENVDDIKEEVGLNNGSVEDDGEESLHVSFNVPCKSETTGSLQKRRRVTLKRDKVNETVNADEVFTCSECRETFPRASRLARHMAVHSKDGKPYKCPQCNAKFTCPGNLTVHLKKHQGLLHFRCSSCDAAFPRAADLRSHTKKHSPDRPYACKICLAAFCRAGDLTPHMRIHTGEKPFQCEVCGGSFSTSSNLAVHRRTHTGERPFQCEHCGASFNQQGHLTRHRQQHANDQSFRCSACPQAFRNAYSLKVHMQRHDVNNVYKCNDCGAAFGRASILIEHRRIHSGQKPYKCTECHMAFARSANLMAHRRTHTGERPYVCQHCNKCFTQSTSLNRHLQSTNACSARRDLFSAGAATARLLPPSHEAPAAVLAAGPGPSPCGSCQTATGSTSPTNAHTAPGGNTGTAFVTVTDDSCTVPVQIGQVGADVLAAAISKNDGHSASCGLSSSQGDNSCSGTVLAEAKEAALADCMSLSPSSFSPNSCAAEASSNTVNTVNKTLTVTS